LRDVARYPVCSQCILAPEPLSAAFFCASCRTPFQNSFPLDAEGRCALCRAGLRGFDAAYSFGAYEGVLRRLIHLFKYAKIHTLAAPLSGLLAQALPRDEAFDAVVPVPLFWWRRLQRGFNQAELLARGLSRHTGVPALNLLRRVHSAPAQAGLSNSARRQNVTRAFRARNVQGKRILLIDDVMTTGATATACSLALKKAGARRVALLTVARVDRRMEGWRLTADQPMVAQPIVEERV
jgi:ComF family protein